MWTKNEDASPLHASRFFPRLTSLSTAARDIHRQYVCALQIRGYRNRHALECLSRREGDIIDGEGIIGTPHHDASRPLHVLGASPARRGPTDGTHHGGYPRNEEERDCEDRHTHPTPRNWRRGATWQGGPGLGPPSGIWGLFWVLHFRLELRGQHVPLISIFLCSGFTTRAHGS